jgi:hypothetical protein
MGRLSIASLLLLATVFIASSLALAGDNPCPRMLRILSPLSEGEVEFEGTVASIQRAGEILVLKGKTPYEIELPASVIVATIRERSGRKSIIVELVEQRSDGDEVLASGKGPNVVLLEGLESPVTSFARTFANAAHE